MARVVAVGSALVDHHYALTNLPEPDGGAFVRDEYEAAGGTAANVATALSLLGREAGVVSRVGSDAAGDGVLADLQSHGIEVTHVQRGDEPSSYCLVLSAPDGERMLVAGGESVPTLRLDAAALDYVGAADAAFTSAYAPDPVVADLAATRRAGDCPPLAFDLAGPIDELVGRGVTRETLDDALSAFDLFVANAVAARAYLGVGPREAAAVLRERGVGRAAITRGPAGAVVLDGEAIRPVEAFGVDAVDTTGAGDAYAAGLLDAWLLDGREAGESARFAAAVAAMNCTGRGARGGLPTREDCEAFLAGR